MNILILGSGGREHALAWKIAASPLVDQLYCAPGNAGIAREAECIALDLSDHADVIAFCKARAIDLVVVGPEGPLAAGIVDDLERAGIKAFGPSKAAARLEGSKGFTKDLCKAHGIPTAAYQRFTATDAAKDYVRARGVPIVIKADGLAAGKGVVVAQSLPEAENAIDMILGGGLGEAGAELVIEEFLAGEEASFFVLCDGDTALPLATAQDHKRAFDGDQGPNTGGMGAYSPAPVMTPEMTKRALDEIVLPTIRAMREMGCPYKGVLYAGLMITSEGPKLIEYNVRFGDPECQVVVPRFSSDLYVHLRESAAGRLETPVEIADVASVGIVLAAEGYPPAPARRGDLVEGLDTAGTREGVIVFHAGTGTDDSGRVVTNGGRVLTVTATGPDVGAARDRAYAAAGEISWPGVHYRRDIAAQALT